MPDNLPDLTYDTPDHDSYRALCDDLAAAGGTVQHRLLGYPQNIQDSMERECQLASHGVYCGGPDGYQGELAALLEPGAADWRLLLQVDSDEESLGWLWGDSGRIYFWIRQQDLKALQFDKAWLILQCY